MHFRTLAGLALLLGGTPLAQTAEPPLAPKRLSLTECIDLALARNFDVQIQHLSADMAAFSLTSSYGAYDPVLSFQARHDFVAQPADFDPKKPGFDSPYELGADTIGPELKGALPFGLSYDFLATSGLNTAQSDLRIASPSVGIRTTNNFDASATLALRQHLLKDFWVDAARELVLVRRTDLKISHEALHFQIMKTVLAVELGFYDLQAARQEVIVREKAVELKRALLAETKRRIELGDLPPLEGEQAASQLQTAMAAVSAARELLFTRQNGLKGLLTDNFRAWAGTELEATGALVAVPEQIDQSQSFLDALRNRPDLIEARLAVEKSDVAVRFRFNQLLPSLDLIGSYGGLGIQPDSSAAISDALHARNPIYYYGAVVSMPLGSVSTRNDYKSSKAAREISKLQLKQAEDGVLLQVADLANRVKTRYEQVDSTHQARVFAEAALAAEQKKLQNGFTTGFTVLQFQEILTTAQNAELQALADYNKMQAQFAFTVGATLERRHIALDTGTRPSKPNHPEVKPTPPAAHP